MKHVYFRALIVYLGVWTRLQYLIVYKSKRTIVCVSSVRSVYLVITNTINNISKSKKTPFECFKH